MRRAPDRWKAHGRFYPALFAFALFEAAYYSQIMRAGFNSVSRKQFFAEGARVVALAALREGRVALCADDQVACVISGGNIDMILVGRSIDSGLTGLGMSVHVLTHSGGKR